MTFLLVMLINVCWGFLWTIVIGLLWRELSIKNFRGSLIASIRTHKKNFLRDWMSFSVTLVLAEFGALLIETTLLGYPFKSALMIRSTTLVLNVLLAGFFAIHREHLHRKKWLVQFVRDGLSYVTFWSIIYIGKVHVLYLFGYLEYATLLKGITLSVGGAMFLSPLVVSNTAEGIKKIWKKYFNGTGWLSPRFPFYRNYRASVM